MIGKNKGFTIIELLVAVLLATIVTGAAMALYITQHKQLIVQDQVSDMQSSVRAAASEIVNQVRMAGFKVPNNFTSLMSSNTNPDTLFIAYNCDINDIHLSAAMPQTSAELKACDSDLTPLHDNEWAYIYDPNTKTGEYFYMTHVQYSSGHIQHNTMSLSKKYPAGSLILKMNFYKYYVDQSNHAHPNLMVTYNGQAAQIYAENITGLNFQYVLSSGTIVDVPTVQDMIREVIIRIDARTDQVDHEFASQYRTRTLTSRVKVRNLGVN
jgi:prepilin-type N-terminal cleavage/methylation domain-containing protein